MKSSRPSLSLDDTVEAAFGLCQALASVSANDETNWELDLRDCTVTGVAPVAIIAAAVLDARRRGGSPSVVLPTSDPESSRFCVDSGLASLLGQGSPPKPDPECRTTPLDVFRRALGNQASPLIRMVERQAGITGDFEFYLGAALGEVVQNVEDHARSSIGGVSSARFDAAGGTVHAAVADRGVTIPGSLGAPASAETLEETLRSVIAGGRTGQSTGRNLGLGLSNLAAIVLNHEGRLFLYSGKGAIVLGPDRAPPRFCTPPAEYPGTVVSFSMRADARP